MNDEQRFLHGLKQLERQAEGAHIVVPWALLVMVVSGLQLALRHPGMPTYSAANLRGFCESVIELIAKDQPGMAGVMQKGFNPACDVKVIDPEKR